jgi:hypothetical protein
MKTETFNGTMENAYGKTLPEPVKFSGSFDSLETIDEVRSANEYPDDKEVVAWANAKRKASARQKAMNAALEAAGITKPTLEDPQVQLATIIKALRASGRSEDEAIALAETALGVKYQR